MKKVLVVIISLISFNIYGEPQGDHVVLSPANIKSHRFKIEIEQNTYLENCVNVTFHAPSKDLDKEQLLSISANLIKDESFLMSLNMLSPIDHDEDYQTSRIIVDKSLLRELQIHSVYKTIIEDGVTFSEAQNDYIIHPYLFNKNVEINAPVKVIQVERGPRFKDHPISLIFLTCLCVGITFLGGYFCGKNNSNGGG